MGLQLKNVKQVWGASGFLGKMPEAKAPTPPSNSISITSNTPNYNNTTTSSEPGKRLFIFSMSVFNLLFLYLSTNE